MEVSLSSDMRAISGAPSLASRVIAFTLPGSRSTTHFCIFCKEIPKACFSKSVFKIRLFFFYILIRIFSYMYSSWVSLVRELTINFISSSSVLVWKLNFKSITLKHNLITLQLLTTLFILTQFLLRSIRRMILCFAVLKLLPGSHNDEINWTVKTAGLKAQIINSVERKKNRFFIRRRTVRGRFVRRSGSVLRTQSSVTSKPTTHTRATARFALT